jgi:HlyD family secretion protein
MEKIKEFIKKHRKKKRFYAIIIVVILILFFILKPKSQGEVLVEEVKNGDIKSTILATGSATSKVDVSLSFNTNGVVKNIKVEVGDEVKKGDILATLDQGSAYATLTSARGALAGAEAKYKKILEGATSEEVALAEVALNNAKNDFANAKLQQDTLVNNAKRALLNGSLVAKSQGDSSTSAPVISGTYLSDEEGYYIVTPYSTGSGGYFNLSGLESGTGIVSANNANLLGTKGLYIQFSSGYVSGSTWKISIPNTESSSYITNLNSYNSALKTRESAISSAQALIDQRNAELNIKKAEARPSDIELAQADILSAKGQLASAEANYENTVIRAPADGTITNIDVKLGELAQAQKEAIILKDIKNLYLEANVNESDVSELEVGQRVDFTTDAYGPSKIFRGILSKVDPAPTTNNSIVNYKINASISEGQDEIHTGMTANLSILVREKKGVVYIPLRFVETDENGKTFVNFVTDKKRNKTEKREVALGISGDGGVVEIISGLSVGESILFKVK